MSNLQTATNRAILKRVRRGNKQPAIAGRRGVTLIELVIAAAASIIVVLSVGFVLADSNRAWHRAYEKSYGGVVVDGFVARRAFDSIIRKASATSYTISDSADRLEVQYYSDINVTEPDRYACFKKEGSSLSLEVGSIDPSLVQQTRTICGNVSGCTFKVQGAGAQMILDLDDGSRSTTVVAGGYMHN